MRQYTSKFFLKWKILSKYIYIIILKNDKKILQEVSMQKISIRRYKKTVEKLLKNDKIYNR